MKTGCVWAYAEFLASITDYQATGESVIADVITFTRVIGTLSGRLQERRPLHSCHHLRHAHSPQRQNLKKVGPLSPARGAENSLFSHCSHHGLHVIQWLELSFRAQFSHFQEVFDRDRILFILVRDRITVKGISQTSFKWITLWFFPGHWIVLFSLIEENSSHLFKFSYQHPGDTEGPSCHLHPIALGLVDAIRAYRHEELVCPQSKFPKCQLHIPLWSCYQASTVPCRLVGFKLCYIWATAAGIEYLSW